MDNHTNENLENEIQIMLEELLETYIAPQNTFRFPSRNGTSAQQYNNMYVINSLNQIMRTYNENIREYNLNMRNYLHTLSSLVAYERNRQGTRAPQPVPRQRPRQDTRFLFTYLFPTTDLSGNPFRNDFRDVVVAPTEEQIANSTRSIIYATDMGLTNTRCPITLDDFVNGDLIRQICHCGHSFGETAIQNWFRTNVRCPVCRYDIRTGQSIASDTSNNVYLDISYNIQNITHNIASILRDYVLVDNQLDASSNRTYTFDYTTEY